MTQNKNFTTERILDTLAMILIVWFVVYLVFAGIESLIGEDKLYISKEVMEDNYTTGINWTNGSYLPIEDENIIYDNSFTFLRMVELKQFRIELKNTLRINNFEMSSLIFDCSDSLYSDVGYTLVYENITFEPGAVCQMLDREINRYDTI